MSKFVRITSAAEIPANETRYCVHEGSGAFHDIWAAKVILDYFPTLKLYAMWDSKEAGATEQAGSWLRCVD